MSKGHAAAALYAVLAEFGYFPVERLTEFYTDGSLLSGHASHVGIPGVEISTGSLGHGPSIAAGMALNAKRRGFGYRTFVVISDGECDEGSVWEAAMFASHHRLSSLTVVVDYNKMQSLATTTETLDLEPFADKWEAFGWMASEVNGHDHQALAATMSLVNAEGRPHCVIAHTTKGKGVSFMEKNKVLWHYRPPDADELQRALAEVLRGT